MKLPDLLKCKSGIYSKVGNGEETTVATYEYDELNQLVKENNKSYSYDFGGNILKNGENTYSYADAEWKDKLTSYNGEAISYDESGNLLKINGASLTWKNGRSLESYVKGDLTVTYNYNTEGLRTEKNVNGTTYKYTWNGTNLTHQAWGNEYIHFYYDSNNSILGFSYFNGTNSSDYSYIKNIQGDVVGIVDSTGNTVASYTYDAWGNILSATGSMAEVNPIRYRGYYYDSETEMYYLQSRYYDQTLDRFINADDAGLVELLTESSLLGANIFAYCENNGVMNVDPNGTISISAVGSFIWKVFVEMIPIIGLLGMAKSFLNLVASFQIPIWGKLKAIAKFIKCIYYIGCIINDINTIYKNRKSKARIIIYSADLLTDIFSLIGSIFNVKIKNFKKAFKKKKSDLYDVIHAFKVVFGNAWFGSRYLMDIAKRFCK